MKYLTIKLVLIGMLWSMASFAQLPDIVGLEYYFDTDPGFGNGTAVVVSAAPTTSTAFDLDISSLDPGIHYAFVRALDDNGVWSHVTKMTFQKVEVIPDPEVDDIVDLEYFIDSDPGFGNGIPIGVTDGPSVTATFDVDVTSLSAGFHKVYFRAQDENGDWSLAYIKTVIKVTDVTLPPAGDIVAMEYFFDSDPGFGSGTPVTVSAGSFTSTVVDVDLSGLDPGYHKVYFRVQDELGKWSLAYIHSVVKVVVDAQAESPDLVALEYFIDTDPGFGNATEVVLTPAPTAALTFDADVSGAIAGDHDMYIRVKDDTDTWSLINVFPFTVSSVELTTSLEGSFNGSDMDTDLNGILPLDQPFTGPPWNYDGTESVGSVPNSNVVDWVLLETRNASDASLATGATRTSRFAAFLLNDGSVVDLDGSSPLHFNAHALTGNYVAVHHRNHLGILSAQELNYAAGIFSYDFTSGLGQAFGNGQKDLGSGVFGLIGGNANSDGLIDLLDLDEAWDLEAGETGYHNGDVNMDTQVDNEDKNGVWLGNIGSESTIPE